MKNLAHYLPWALPLLLVTPALCQISQNHPELCGSPSESVPVPKGVSAAIEHAKATLTISTPAATRIAKLPWAEVLEIQEVCPVGTHRLVVFGWVGAYEMSLIDLDDGAVLDSFIAYSPIMSPDHRWLTMRRFYPFHTEFVVSDEYILYDLNADADTNRHGPDENRNLIGTPGWAIYPALAGNLQIEPGIVPPVDIHQFRSDSFFWDPSSRYVAFADARHEITSVILSRIEDGKITSWIHPISASELCAAAPDWRLSKATISLIDPDSPVAVLQFYSSQATCIQRPLTLTLADFRPAALESYKEPAKQKPTRKEAPSSPTQPK